MAFVQSPYKPNSDIFYEDMLVPDDMLTFVFHSFERFPVQVRFMFYFMQNVWSE